MKKSTLKEVFATDINNAGKFDFVDFYVTVEDYLSITDTNDSNKNQSLDGYDRNRAGTPLNRIHVVKIADNLYVPALGVFPMAKNTNNNEWNIYDGHNRTAGLHERFKSGNMKKEELDSLVLLRIIPYKYALDMYVFINNVEKHTNANKYLNPDLPAGKFIVDIITKAGLQTMKSQWKRQLFNQCVAVAYDDLNADYKTVSAYYAKEANSLLNVPPSKKGKVISRWTDKNEEKILFALSKMNDAYDEIEKISVGNSTENLKTLLKSARFFGIILNYATSTSMECSCLFKNKVQFATNIVSKAKELNDIMKDYTRKTTEKDDQIHEIFSYNIGKRSNSITRGAVTTGFKRIIPIAQKQVQMNN